MSTPRDSHHAWVTRQAAAGWGWGWALDAAAKTHPMLRPFDQLTIEQRNAFAVPGVTPMDLDGAPAVPPALVVDLCREDDGRWTATTETPFDRETGAPGMPIASAVGATPEEATAKALALTVDDADLAQYHALVEGGMNEAEARRTVWPERAS